MSLGIPIKQELGSESSSSYEEPGPFNLDFTLYDPESVPEFMACFDHNHSAVYAPVPGGHAHLDNTRFPL